jgi:hypothetical protein
VPWHTQLGVPLTRDGNGVDAELFYEIARKLPKAQPAAPVPGGIILNNNQAPKAPKKSSCC